MAVSLGRNFLVAVNSDGVVFTCGQNNYGQLGCSLPNPNFPQRALPGPIDLNSVTDQGTAIMVSAGTWHTACVTRKGSVYTWGNSHHGQLGCAVVRSQPIPHCAYSAAMGQLPATMVACGRNHTLILTAAGSTMVVTASGVLWASGVSRCHTMGLGARTECHTFNRVGGDEYFGEGGVRSVTCSATEIPFLAPR